ncbi:NACHT and TPR domain protein [Aspergillus aculeatinus CBS 121060]|uniref:Tetratricopeptide repeat domain protein n=1 Tax=Aspergillus aculeatinus CBS 121060 TaxID=1448322 RepID=A0ACD1H3G1_9EURO|nr:tetratricopeptide repeat domain protein [Aspergillus aculeatinus CBS 121060]RAH68312.1 tetratricopeptide repeat domain protein [Aspergillus aculeatinus CBS 121060]
MATAQIPQLWATALARYEKITHSPLDPHAWRDLTTVDGLWGAIEAENQSFQEFRRQRAGLCAALSQALRPIELVGDLAASAAGMFFAPSSLVFGAVRYLVDAARGVSAKYDAIVELMVTLQDFTTRLAVYAQQQISPPLQEKITAILTTLLEVFAISRQQIRLGRLRSFGKNVLLGSDDGKAAIAKLAHLVDGERNLVGAETLTEVKGAKVVIDRVDVHVLELTRRIDDLNRLQEHAAAEKEADSVPERNHPNKVKSVLQPATSADDRYSMIARARVPQTGDWVRDEREFREWLRRDKPLLWVTGTPGAGKSYLAASIIAYLRELYPQNVQHPSHVSVAYYFFKDDNVKTRSCHKALRDVAFKIAQNDPAYANFVAGRVDSPEDIGSLSSLWQQLFVEYFIAHETGDSQAYIVLDALDEAFAEERQELFQLAGDIQPGGRLQLLLLGRPHIAQEMDELMEQLAVPTIYISDVNNSDDIVRYIQSSIAKSVYLRRASKALQAEIVRRVSSGAQGMFLWVDFMLKELLKKRDEARMRKALEEAPRGLSEMIRHVLKSYSESLRDAPQYAEDLNEMLAWIVCAHWPLKLQLLESIVQWRSPEGEGWIWLEGYLRREYASLFSLIREDGLSTADLQRANIGRADWEVDTLVDDGFDDTDNPSDFDSDPATTEVTLNHASLGDFFRNEAEVPVSADDGPLVGIDYHAAKVLVFKRYFEIVACEEGSPKQEIAQVLRVHAAGSIVSALQDIEIDKCSPEDKGMIGLSIARLLSVPPILEAYVKHRSDLSYPGEHLELFMKWLRDPDVQASLPPTEKAWFEESTASGDVGIYLLTAKFIAEQWLQKGFWLAGPCCRYIMEYIKLSQDAPPCPDSPVEAVLSAAEWCGFAPDQLWHRRLAIALRDLGFLDECIPRFQRAVDLDPSPNPQTLLARAGMAKAYLEMGQFAQAVEQDRVCVAELNPHRQADPDQPDLQAHASYERLGQSYTALGEVESAVAMYRAGLATAGFCNTCLCAMLEQLHAQSRHEEIIALLKSLDRPAVGQNPASSTTTTTTTPSILTQSILTNPDWYDDFIDRVTAAAASTQQIPFLIDAYTTAVATAHKQRKAVAKANLEFCLGMLWQTHGRDGDRAAALWERLIATYRGSRAEGEMVSVLEMAAGALATHYLTKAMEVGVASEQGRRYGVLLELLARGKAAASHGEGWDASRADARDVVDAPPPNKVFVTTSPVGLILGSYYRLSGREADAMACYKAQVQAALRLVEDERAGMAMVGYTRLSSVFAALGEDEEALAMWYQDHLMYELMERDDDEDEGDGEAEAEAGSDAADDPEDSKRPTFFTCNGCSTSVEIDGNYICRYCHDVLFCLGCMQRLETGTLGVRVCSAQHAWAFVARRPEAVRRRGEEQRGMLWLRGEWVEGGVWKAELRRRWGL